MTDEVITDEFGVRAVHPNEQQQIAAAERVAVERRVRRRLSRVSARRGHRERQPDGPVVGGELRLHRLLPAGRVRRAVPQRLHADGKRHVAADVLRALQRRAQDAPLELGLGAGAHTRGRLRQRVLRRAGKLGATAQLVEHLVARLMGTSHCTHTYPYIISTNVEILYSCTSTSTN